ncbi:alpha/beta-hydrolase [Abortiporus biennis]|nr:alpha/beta-hydrolase [Abortiporus biennis]
MWFPRGFPISILGLASQVPIQPPSPPPTMVPALAKQPDFKFKEGTDRFTPNDLIQLARPGAGVANPAGDLVLVPVSKYSLKDKKNNKSIFLAPIESAAQPLEIPLANGGEAFWLGGRTVAHAVDEGEGKDKVKALYAISVKFETTNVSSLALPDPPTLIGKFPTDSATNFRYSEHAGVLVFSDYVWPDGDLKTVKEQDEAWENRGDSAYVYDETFERHWDTWTGPKKSSLFSVKLAQDPDRVWNLGTEFINLLKDTDHSAPVEPFGGTDDFDISNSHVIYTTKDPKLPPAWHTKQDVHIVPIFGGQNKELTSGKQGATHSPVLSAQGDKAAWLELDEDGFESDRAKIVIYDLNKGVSFRLTEHWDRSPDALYFSPDGKYIYFTAGDSARVKVFALPIPPTPSASSNDPQLASQYTTPIELTSSGAASGLQALPNSRILFTRSSLTSPNDVFVIRNLDKLDLKNKDEIKIERLTQFTEDALSGKSLSEGEDFWFEGAEGKTIHGFSLKPPGFKKGDKKKWPVVLLIHGGPEGAWEDQWSTRWNPNVFTSQGYFTIAINPTGSTTFGQELTNAIKEDWGGKPFVDLQKGWKYILDKYPEIDADRAVAAGASYGGYAINWIQGHPEFGFGFKALVCHDGAFDVRYTGYVTDELFFNNYEFGGRPWEPEAAKIVEKNNPVNHVNKFSTPQLIIHSSKDYRLVEGDGIGIFHALQQLHIPSRLVIFPDENHWVLNHGNSLKWHYEVFRWFDKYVGDKNEN